ncbi:hypothetical protein AB0D42_27035 [Streptomyces sp. NPDC048304]|uniref:hypothetical protein n=1 Tax=Streptomyces sp. NPDC048304 TaxID=3154820 RepID=UPI00340EAD3D
MAHVVNAETALAEARAAADPERPAGPAETWAMRLHTDRHQELEELNAQHALLMHAHVMADAEAAVVTARHDVIVAAARATEDLPPRSAAEMLVGHQAFMARVTAAEDRIAHTLREQRQITRDALQRLFPQSTGQSGLHHLRTRLIGRAGLGFVACNAAWNAIGDTARTLESLEAAYRSDAVEFSPPARDRRAGRTGPHRRPGRRTLLRRPQAQPSADAARRQGPGRRGRLGASPAESIAQRAARIIEQSRRRAQQPAPAVPRNTPAADRHQQTQSPQTPPAPGARLP